MTGRAKRGVVGALIASLALGVLALPATAAKDDLDLVSRATGGAAANKASSSPSTSADGRLVAFASDGDNLSDADRNGVTNIFVRDITSGVTTLATPAPTTPTPFTVTHTHPVLSGDGRFVAWADDDITGTESFSFIREGNLAAGVTFTVSGPAVGSGTYGDSFAPSLSSDGRFVAFESDATNLTPDVNGVRDVFVRDTVANTTTLVSRASGPGGAPGNGGSFAPSISADGRFVAFSSDATNFSADDLDGTRDVFVRDLVNNTTTLVDRASAPGNAVADDDSFSPSISADGNRVAFGSRGGNLSPDDTSTTSSQDVFVRDLVAQTTTFVSRASGATGAPADLRSGTAAISADGRYVAFASEATNLSDVDTDTVPDVFVRDLTGATTTLVSRAAGATGPGAADISASPSISADGRYVAFESTADNLAADDTKAVSDVFRRDLLGPPPPAPPTPAPPGIVAASARCAGLKATIVGTAGRDLIRGTARRDVIAALGGNDVVRGLGGNDLICLGAGNDTGIGGAGADRILAGPGGDLLVGGPGRDRLIGALGRDRTRGGAGVDFCRAEARIGC